MKEFLMGLLISAPGILFGLTVHEYAHGYAAYKMGDPTAKLAGRLTLNPIPHLDLLGTAMLFLVHFGWAKPVPINPAYFRDRRKGIIYTSFAGPLANIIVAFIFGLILRFVFVPNLLNPSFSSGLIQIVHLIIFYAVFINLILAFFNLIPIPPLDGSHILKYLLPSQARTNFEQIERFGPFILIGIIFLGRMAGISIFGLIILPPVDFFFKLFTGIPLGIYGIM